MGRAGGVRTTVTEYDYDYDDANNRESKTVTGGSEAGTWSYTSNALNQLTGFERESGATGPVAVSYTYDANGNRVTRTADGVLSDNYAWDDENRLIEVEKGGATHRYEYDYRTRRISREEPPVGGGAAVKTAVVFAGGLSVAEYVANATTPTVEYVRGPDLGGGVGGMLYTLRPEGGALAAKYSYANGRGDVVAQANQSGTVTWTASYEAFGTRKLETGTNVDRQRANTKEEDPTGLLNEGFRYRDLETGTWLSRDPAGFVDGPNLYAYVKCNPWTAWDPEGLSAYSDFSDAAARDIAEGRSVRGYTKAVLATAWNTMSFGLAESAGGIQDSYQADEISGRQALAQAAMATGGAVKDAAQTYAGGALKSLGAAGKALNGVARGSDALDTAEGLVATGRELAAGNADGLKGKVLGAAVSGGVGKLGKKTGWGEQPGSPHLANVTVRGPDGKIVHKGRTKSGSLSPTEKEIGFPQGQNASHTEARAVMDPSIPSGVGHTMTITGGKPPCNSCRGYMNTHAEATGTNVRYQWRQNGKTNRWETGK